jgi:DNA helicase HerA-like ATPase
MSEFQNNNRITPFAITDYRDIRKIFGIKEKNRRGHIYIIGKTGTGKTTLIENMAISDIENNCGVALIDPHGDMSEEILDYIPTNRVRDVIYFNPADLENPIAFNPLEKVPKDFHHLVASGIVSTFKKIWSESWGPRLEHILRHALLSLLEYPNSTLLDLPKLLTDNSFRNKVLAHITHPQVRDFWLLEFEKYSVWLRSEAVSPILNKIGQFLTSIPLRNIVGQKENTFDLRKLMDEGKILIVNLAKGKIGEDNCSLLGALVLTKIELSALSRADLPEDQRAPFYLFVDEIHSFITLSFADILSESRKYGLNLVLAHQYIEQLDEKIRAAIFGNVGTIISFRIGAEDAKYLAQEFAPVFDETDLINLPNFHIYLKLMIDGQTSQPFSAKTLRLREINTSHKEEIIVNSRNMYTRQRADVERDILYRPAASSQIYDQQQLF